jgi:rSAM/selenodomain-associated transferase 1
MQPPVQENAIIVFAREPVPGRVKTRLAAAIGDQAAAERYDAMLRDVLETTRQLSGVETVVYWSCEEEALPRLAERYHCRSRMQGTGNLGQRMQTAFEEMFADGCKCSCIIGSDAPDLPLSYIRTAFQLLQAGQSVAVFGPSRDGGYYLLGLRQVHQGLFSDISWSSAKVLSQSLAAAHGAGLTTTLLPEWQDIDTVEDLHDYQQRNCLIA